MVSSHVLVFIYIISFIIRLYLIQQIGIQMFDVMGLNFSQEIPTQDLRLPRSRLRAPADSIEVTELRQQSMGVAES
jgi:hypothetical protein